MSKLRRALIQAAAGNAAGEGEYIEDLFSTYLYAGNSSAQTITNGIDLDGEGGLVWLKSRTVARSHFLADTERGSSKTLSSDGTGAETTDATRYTAFNSNGFSVGTSSNTNNSGEDYVSWTFRKAPKFFDVVTYTGNGTARTISHNLGSAPGCIIIKDLSAADNWYTFHRGTGNDKYLELNTTDATTTDSIIWNNTAPADSVFSIGASGNTNRSGRNYVAYLFAHNDDDGEFGEDADQDIIKCGSYTGNGSTDGPEIDLGFEPQWVFLKSTGTGSWNIMDNMRGVVTDGNDAFLEADTTDIEEDGVNVIDFNATGFKLRSNGGAFNGSGTKYIYIAIRRGPMKTPESGTEVFQTLQYTGSGSTVTRDTNILVDALFSLRTGGGFPYAIDRMRGGTQWLRTSTTDTESTQSTAITDMGNDFLKMGGGAVVNSSATDYALQMFRRAPGFFDVVAYEGDDSSTRTLSHNLNVVPEIIFFKRRSSTAEWKVWSGSNLTDASHYLVLNETSAEQQQSGAIDIVTSLSETEFTVRNAIDGTTGGQLNRSSETYIAYLFATLEGVSKVGSYTGNGSSQTIDCGFSNGARFVMTKRINSFGHWNIWDTERGIVAGNDPRLELDTSDAEDTGHDYIDPDSSGFIVNFIADDNDDSNVSGDEYIFLAIA